eukprot:gnl/TRDRNA2_/TRDRNA2_134735_c0_seq1.p1 gnl/TRDRNA2_/TRDRNA2_134735_c0~~gnl/TRDRNA2_/TRDRNA2_134735_c0_seq1.p1  ORF type:complete len:579 (-),score=125.67 gnl/TRDRNA2_/TRDRNA2_134735_c0_seq1:24-1760(-)
MPAAGKGELEQEELEHEDRILSADEVDVLQSMGQGESQGTGAASMGNPLLATRGFAGFFARINRHRLFEPVVLTVIVINALWIGFDVDQADPDGAPPPYYFTMVENFFGSFFTAEIIIRFLAYRKKKDFFLDEAKRFWNIFDGALVSQVIFESVIAPNTIGTSPNLPGFSMLRLLRLLRLTRVLRMVPELLMMVKSLGAAIRSVSMTFCLALGIMYIFSIIFTQWAISHTLIHECDPEEDECPMTPDEAFGTISRSLLTLCQVLCFDDTFSLIRGIMQESMFYGLLIILFILIAAFTVLNMLIGVICEIVSSTCDDERDKMMRDKVEYLFAQIDSDSSGGITKRELLNAQAAKELAKLGIDRELMLQAFELMDTDDNDFLEMEEFLEIIFKLLHPPEAQDIILLQKRVSRLTEVISKRRTAGGFGNAKVQAMQQLEKARAEAASWPAVPVPSMPSQGVGQQVDELEQQVSAIQHHFRTLANDGEDDGLSAIDRQEIRSLESVLYRLRVRLERAVFEDAVPDEPGPLLPLDDNMLKPFRRLCEEVLQSMTGASALLARTVRAKELMPSAAAGAGATVGI